MNRTTNSLLDADRSISYSCDRGLWLVVEDEEDQFLLFQRACRRLTPKPVIHRARDGVEAQTYLAQAGRFDAPALPDVILCDLKMPRMNGFELLDWVKKQPLLHSIPFFLFTCSTLQLDRDRARTLEADDYVVKPANFTSLVETLEQLLQRTAPPRVRTPDQSRPD